MDATCLIYFFPTPFLDWRLFADQARPAGARPNADLVIFSSWLFFGARVFLLAETLTITAQPWRWYHDACLAGPWIWTSSMTIEMAQKSYRLPLYVLRELCVLGRQKDEFYKKKPSLHFYLFSFFFELLCSLQPVPAGPRAASRTSFVFEPTEAGTFCHVALQPIFIFFFFEVAVPGRRTCPTRAVATTPKTQRRTRNRPGRAPSGVRARTIFKKNGALDEQNSCGKARVNLLQIINE